MNEKWSDIEVQIWVTVELVLISSSLGQLNFLVQNALNVVIYTSSSMDVNVRIASCHVASGPLEVTSWTIWRATTSSKNH